MAFICTSPHRRLPRRIAGKGGHARAPAERDWCRTGHAVAGCAGQGV